MTIPIHINQQLSFPFFEKTYRDKISEHFKKLSYKDRYLRFCVVLSDEAIDNYVDKINFKHDECFAIIDDIMSSTMTLDIIGFLHISPLNDDSNDREFGISVDEEYRNKGFAKALFQSGIECSEHKRYENIYMNCLYENKIMRHIVKNEGFDIESDFQDVTAKLQVDNSTPIQSTFLFQARSSIAIFDLAYRSKIRQAKDFIKFFKV